MALSRNCPTSKSDIFEKDSLWNSKLDLAWNPKIAKNLSFTFSSGTKTHKRFSGLDSITPSPYKYLKNESVSGKEYPEMKGVRQNFDLVFGLDKTGKAF